MLSKKKVLILNGGHGSGKSTLAAALPNHIPHSTYFDEVGYEVRKEFGGVLTGNNEAFDREIMQRELKRDEQILNSPNFPIIETWHVGNMAYAKNRSPIVMEEYEQALTQQLEKFEPVAIVLKINRETFRKRMKQELLTSDIGASIDFFDKIITDTCSLYEKYGIAYHVIDNSDLTIDEAISTILKRVS